MKVIYTSIDVTKFGKGKMNRIKNIIIVVCGLLFLALAGCNTMEGAGKDIERGGEKIQEAAK